MNAQIKERIDIIKRGEIPEGYKRTKIGLFPIEWENVVFYNIFDIHDDLTDDKDRYPLYSLTIEDGVIPKSERYERSFLVTKDSESYKIVFPYDFVYNPMNLRFGAISQYKGEIQISVSGYYDVFYIKNDYSHKYIESVLKSDSMIAYYNTMATGSLIEKQRVHFSQFLQFRLPIASKKEQQKIAEIITHCDKVIDLKKQLIEEKNKQKRWLMQNLLDPDSGVRLPGFNGMWEERKMGELFSYLSSVSATREQLSDIGYCYLHYGDIHKSSKNYVDVVRDFDKIPKLKIDVIPKNALLKHGDIVFVDASEDYEGASKYVVIENISNITFIAGLHTIVARDKNDVLDISFKKYCFQSYDVKKQIAFYASGMKVVGLSKASIANLNIKYPKRYEQIAIANILSDADKEIDLLEQELDQWQNKKKALIQLLLTGIVRVK